MKFLPNAIISRTARSCANRWSLSRSTDGNKSISTLISFPSIMFYINPLCFNHLVTKSYELIIHKYKKHIFYNC